MHPLVLTQAQRQERQTISMRIVLSLPQRLRMEQITCCPNRERPLKWQLMIRFPWFQFCLQPMCPQPLPSERMKDRHCSGSMPMSNRNTVLLSCLHQKKLLEITFPSSQPPHREFSVPRAPSLSPAAVIPVRLLQTCQCLWMTTVSGKLTGR